MTILLSRSGSGSRAYTILNVMQKPPEFNNYSRTSVRPALLVPKFLSQSLILFKKAPSTSIPYIFGNGDFFLNTYIHHGTYILAKIAWWVWSPLDPWYETAGCSNKAMYKLWSLELSFNYSWEVEHSRKVASPVLPRLCTYIHTFIETPFTGLFSHNGPTIYN